MVSLGRDRGDGSIFSFCGGSLIAPDMVLSAAHCGKIADLVEVGRHDRSDAFASFESIGIVEEFQHPLYVEESFRYDILLIKLKEPSDARPVKVNLDRAKPPPGSKASVFGWGITKEGDTTSRSPVLRSASLTTLSNGACEDSKDPLFPWNNYRGQVFPEMLCAFEENVDSCQGDSGTFSHFPCLWYCSNYP